MKAVELVQVNFFKFLLNELQMKGSNISKHIRKSQMNYFNLDDTDQYVPVHCMYRLFEEVETEEGIPDFLSTFEQAIKVKNLYNYGAFMLSAPDLLSAAEYSMKYAPLNLTNERDGLDIKGNRSTFWIRIIDSPVTGLKHVYDLQLAFIIDHIQRACGTDWSPLEIHYPFESAPDIDKILPDGHNVKLIINQSRLAVVFETYSLSRPVMSNDLSFPGDYHLTSLNTGDKIEKVLNSCIQGHIPTLTFLSDILNTSVRTLQRNLKEEDTSYEYIVDRWRFTQSLELLANHKLRIKEISERLGYLKPESFHRAFKRWTGSRPQEFRNSL